MLDVQVELGADGSVPTEFMIFGAGVTETTKGPIRFTARAGKSVMSRMANLGRDALPFDYGHGQVSMLKSHESQRAAGWFKPQVRQTELGPELWATDISWTPTARQALADKEYRYFSPTLYRDSETGEVTELTNIALTNLPATKNQTPLVGLDTQGSSVEIETLLAAFGVKDLGEAVTKVTKLQTENGQLLDAAKALQTELADVKAQLAKVAEDRVAAERSNLVDQLSREGKLPPALKTWALSQSLDSLKAFAAAAPVAPAAGAKVQPAPAPGGGAEGVALSREELAICKQMQVKPADYAKTRTLLSQQESFWAARGDGEQWVPSGHDRI